MANLTYNSNIFTNLHKWDNEYAYLGIQISGKLNQYNGQDYPLLDAIDIDWDGAFINKMNTYIYTTEDLIKLFNKFAQQDIDINSNIANNYYTKNDFDTIFNDYRELVSNEFDEMTYIMEESILQSLLGRYEVLNAISEVLIDRTRYLEIPYNKIVNINNYTFTEYAEERVFFTFNEETGLFSEVTDKNSILYNPDEQYYIFIMDDIIKLNDNVNDIYKQIGAVNFNNTTYTYTYTGFYNRFNNVETDISYLSDYLDNNTLVTIDAYNYAYSGYITSNINSEKIGYHTQYNVYKKVEDINSQEFINYKNANNNNVFIRDSQNPNSYVSTQYTGNPNLEYYMLYNKINGTGIEKEIEDLSASINENTYLLYHLNTRSNHSYVKLNIDPPNTSNRTINRTIIIDLINSYVDSYSGEITNGIANQNTIINGVSYLLNWEYLK